MPIDPATITFIEPTPNDFKDFLDLRKSVMKPIVINQGLPWDEQAEDLYHQELFASPGLLKIMAGEERVGYIGLSETSANDIEISRFCIDADHQNNGLGRYILNEYVFNIPEFKGKDFILEVLKANPAQSLYESLGFEVQTADDKLITYRKKSI